MKVYVSSKVKYQEFWRGQRSLAAQHGVEITSSWIDMEGEIDFKRAWMTWMDELRECDVLVAYVAPGEVLKGALVEVGAVLVQHKLVYLFGDGDVGSWTDHPLVVREYGPMTFLWRNL